MNNEFKLIGLTAYPELEGFNFFELDARFQRHIENRTIRCLVILKETHPQVKFDVFERLNTGSVKLTPQELRHGIYYGDMILLCEKLAINKQFNDMIDLRDNKRMKLEELVLRFLALHYEGDKYKKPLSGFLNSFAESNRNLTEDQKATFTEIFNRTTKVAQALYGKHAFNVLETGRRVLSRFNAAIYDAEMIAASEFNGRKKLPPQAKVLDTIEKLLADDVAFRKAVTQATSDEAQVKTRCQILTKTLATL